MRTRQALVTCSRLEDGTPALRLIDLRTDLPFFLMDDEPHSSLVVTGSFAVRLGQGVIGAVSHFCQFHRNGRTTMSVDELANFVAGWTVRAVGADDRITLGG